MAALQRHVPVPRETAAAVQAAHEWAGSSVVEHVTFNHVVVGSTPTRLTIRLLSLEPRSGTDAGLEVEAEDPM